MLKHGTALRAHRTNGWVQIQVVAGLVRLRVAERLVEVGRGEILVLEPRVPHDVEAIGESAFLLTIGRMARQSAEESC